MRNLHLDALRGYCLLVMTIDHLGVYGLTRVTHETYGFFDAAEGFIFISALVAGSYYPRLAERSGETAMTKRTLRRARDLYLTHIVLLAFVLGGAELLMARSTHMVRHSSWVHTPHPLTTLLLAATFLVQPQYLDILPFYALMLLFVPLLVRSWKARRAGWVLSLSGGLWLLSQPGVFVSLCLPAWMDLGTFSFFAWQFLFVCGFTMACLHRSQGVGTWLDSPRTWVMVVPLFGLLLVIHHVPLAPNILNGGVVDFWTANSWWIAKHTLGPLRIISFMLFAYLLAQVCKRCGPGLEKTRLHRYLRFLGQHSLQVYAWSVLVCYAVPYAYEHVRVFGSRGAQIALALIGVATLIIPARLHAIYRERWSGRAAPPQVELLKRAACGPPAAA